MRTAFRQRLMQVEPARRDGWVDDVLGLRELPDDGGDLPPGCVPYLPTPVDTLLRTIERAGVTEQDVFVDVGSGVGRAMMLVHLLTGAGTIGLEIQAALVDQARRLAAAHGLERVRTVHGDAADLVGLMTTGSVFFFYCPFSGDRLARVLDLLHPLARARPLRLCFVDMPVPDLPWLVEDPVPCADRVAVCRTRIHAELCR